MLKILLYLAVVFVFVVLRLRMAKNNAAPCRNALYQSPARSYIWQTAGMLVIFSILSGLVYFNMNKEIDAFMPNLLFVMLVGVLSGFCAFSFTMFAFTRVGIYSNGILTHFMFADFAQIESYKISDSNMLNFGRETKTVIVKLKDNTSNHPSFEYPRKDEERIKEILLACDIPEFTSAE